MLATFSLRLACGLAALLLLLPPALINPRFYRAHFWTILGLLVIPLMAAPPGMTLLWWWLLGASMLASYGGSLAWSLDKAPGGRILIALTAILTVATLVSAMVSTAGAGWFRAAAEDLSSAALLGAAFTAMLAGHSYLLMPTMSLVPLLRLIKAFYLALLLRMGMAGVDLWSMTHGFQRLPRESDTIFWLALRWGLGFAIPLILGVLAWKTARMRSTQSATGILYVVVIFCFLGELASQLLSSPSVSRVG